MSRKFDAIYAAYLSGTSGQSFALFAFCDGVVGGADISGTVFSGHYAVTEDDQYVEGELSFIVPEGEALITGTSSQAGSARTSVPFKLPIDFNENDVFRIETPFGPVNARFRKATEL